MNARGLAPALALAASLLFAAASPAASGPVGMLTQLPGSAGCLSQDGSSADGASTCQNVRGLHGLFAVSVSPDGRNVYTAGVDGGGGPFAIFSRDPSTGQLTQLPGTAGCITADGASEDGPGTCTDGRATHSDAEGPPFVFSPDGKFAYAAAASSKAIDIFSRDPSTGALTQLGGTAGCISQDGSSEDGANTCQDGRQLEPDGLAISPDGSTIYAASPYPATSGNEPGISIFHRDAATGELTQLPGATGCVTDSGASEDGAGTCTPAREVNYSNTVVVSPDGKNVYTSGYSDDGVAIFSRDPSGQLTQLPGLSGCISASGSSNAGASTCADGRALDGVWSVAISPDGSTVYATGYNTNGILSFARNPSDGSLTQLPGTSGCITGDGSSEDGPGTCQDGYGANEPWTTTVSPDGESVYTAQYSDGVTFYTRNPATGALTQPPEPAGCLFYTSISSDGSCTDTVGLQGAGEVELSPDGRFAYVASYSDQTLTVFSRQEPPSCSDSRASAAAGSTVRLALTCTDPNGDAVTRSITSGPAHGTLGAIDQANGTVTYTSTANFNGMDTITFSGTDGSGVSSSGNDQIAVKDDTRPVCRQAGAKLSFKQLRAGNVRLRVSCSEAARITAALQIDTKSAKKLHLSKIRYRTIGKGKVSLSKQGGATLSLKLSRKTAKRLKHMSASKLGQAKLRLQVKAVDTSGNARTSNFKEKLKKR
jgi:Big-like domain-containing protein